VVPIIRNGVLDGACGATQQKEDCAMPVSRDGKSSLEPGVPCHHGERVK